MSEQAKNEPEQMIETLGHALPKEIARVQELLGEYIAIGPAGQFGAAMLRQKLAHATQAMAEGDLVNMIQAHQELKECE